jgi:hypothetical protein
MIHSKAGPDAGLNTGREPALPSTVLPQNTATADDRRDTINADLIKSLQTIANIESIDPDGIRHTWRSLAMESAMIAREALAYHEIHTGSGEALSDERSPGIGAFSNGGADHMVHALREIANVEFLDPGHYTWKDRASIAGAIAREALAKIEHQYESGQEESLSSGALSDIRGPDIQELDHEYEENECEHSFSF